MIKPEKGRLAVYESPQAPFVIRELPLRAPHPAEVLVKIRMSTICRSDIHSYLGHRPNPCPGVLGHEIIGDIVELGDCVTHDMRGSALMPGDRITWSEFFIPGTSFHTDVLDLPQKAPGVEKYGHMAVTTDPHHHGGFGEYCYVLPRSWILKLPSEISDEEATPINCGVATMICVTEQAEIRIGDSVLIQGLGLLGLYGAAIAKARGAKTVIGLDTVAARRELGRRFGVDHALDPGSMSEAELAQRVLELCPPEGADAVIEVCGDPGVIPVGLQCLRTGGRYVLGGVVNPDSSVRIDANLVLRKLITLRGVHNYHPRNLLEALDFVQANRLHFPFHELVDGKYRLDEVGKAMEDAAERRVLRAAIIP
ncbi:MAG: zinc-binding dehydrogenase [Betaproteobacteria bacterium]|jgi:putative phosphonate catabolism associated alcohol dehydrogenase|nr:zinc-binding dehydrogenase [Betaproteobacteria bacterium]